MVLPVGLQLYQGKKGRDMPNKSRKKKQPLSV